VPFHFIAPIGLPLTDPISPLPLLGDLKEGSHRLALLALLPLDQILKPVPVTPLHPAADIVFGSSVDPF